MNLIILFWQRCFKLLMFFVCKKTTSHLSQKTSALFSILDILTDNNLLMDNTFIQTDKYNL